MHVSNRIASSYVVIHFNLYFTNYTHKRVALQNFCIDEFSTLGNYKRENM